MYYQMLVSQQRGFALLSALFLVISQASIGFAQPVPDENFDKPAHFRVTTEVVNEDVPPFTATIGSVGNTLLKQPYGFEAQNFRSQWQAQEDAKGKVIVGEHLAYFDTLRDGFLANGFVRVYRVVDGSIQIIADETIAEDGFVVRGWKGGNLGRAIPAGTERWVQRWANWERPGVPYYFAVAAVDEQGNISKKSDAVRIIPPDNFGDAKKVKNERKRIKESRNKDGSAPPAPQNVTYNILEDGTAEITWDAVQADDLAGYVIYSSDYDPETHEGYFIKLSDPELAIKKGDLVIAGRELTEFREDMVSNRIYGAERQVRRQFGADFPYQDLNDETFAWQLGEHGEETIVEEPGKHYLQISLGEGETYNIGEYNHSGADQTWYNVLEPGVEYVVEVWLKYEGPAEGNVTFRTNGVHEDDIPETEFKPTGEWQKFEMTFSVPEMAKGSQPSRSDLVFRGPGIYSIDNFRMYQKGTDYLDLIPRDYQRIADSGMISLRTHGPIKTRQTTYSMEQFTNPGGVIRGIQRGNTLPQTLEFMRKAEQIPWLQIEYHMSPDEWAAFMEYIAAPYDPVTDSPETKPWAAKRYAQGQEEPWVDEFDTILFELANETWNGLFAPWTFRPMPDHPTGERHSNGYVYGLFQEHVRDLLRSSPYWTSELDEKFVFVIGGWGSRNYGFDAAKASPNSRFITNAAYNGGWDEGEGPPQPTPASYFNVLAQVNQTAIPRAISNAEKLAEVKAETGATHQELGVYEAGPGYALNGLNNARVTPEQARGQELVMKSMTAGTATLDSFLARAYHGFKIDNFFTFSEGSTWSSHAEWYRSGQPYPQWAVLEVFNNHGHGDFLKVETESVPTIDLPGFKRRQETPDAPLAAVYATKEGDRLTLYVLSRKVPNYPKQGDDGYIPVTVDLPISNAEEITLHKLTGDHTAQNFDSHEVSIETQGIPLSAASSTFSINAATGADDRGLPPASSFIYVFEGVSFLSPPRSQR